MPAGGKGNGLPGGVRPFVVFVAGVIRPAEISYAPLLGAIGGEVRAALKDLEVYAGGTTPPPDYAFDTEVAGVERVAAEAERGSVVHLVGYSAGGAAALAFAARYPGRVGSLALIEPSWIGNEGRTPEEAAFWAQADGVMALPPAERLGGFLRLLLRPGVEPPPRPPGPPPPWMATRPAGVEALHRACEASRFDPEGLRGFRRPVYLALGALSIAYFHAVAQRLSGILPNAEVEIYEDRHHLDPPHMADPERFARALRELWGRTPSQA